MGKGQRQTWWGDVDGTGPYHPEQNPDGTGQGITGNVAFDPWVTDTPLDYVYTNFSAGAPTELGSLPQPTLVQGTLSDEWDPTNRSPGRTMVYDRNAVEIAYTGLDSAARYRLYVTYFNADPGGSLQSLTDGAGSPLHGTLGMPNQPTQYGFILPQGYYADGNLTLRFVHDDPQSSLRASVSEVWIVEETGEIAPPRFDRVAYNDVDGSGDYSVGDELWFTFTQPLDPSLVQDGTPDANLRLPPDSGASYGDVNAVRWTADQRTVVVTLTNGFTVSGGETVTPSGLTDTAGQAAIGIQTLPSADTVSPAFLGLDWEDADGDGSVSVGDRYVFRFSEAMDTSAIRDGTADANVHLRPQGGTRYGTAVPAAWSADARSLTVAVSDGFTVVGNELVVPSSLVRDVAGNPVTGTQRLKGRDTEPPTIVSVRFDEADGSGTVTPGDRYVFAFSEPMRTSALSDGTTEANWNLPPAGRKYGDVNRITWNADATEVTVWVTQGHTVRGGETVDPTDLVTDRAGNPVVGTITLPLPGTDTVSPRVAVVEANYLSPVNAVDTYRLTVRFDSAMDTGFEPVLQITGTGAVAPSVPAGGTWSTTLRPNDTYTTPFIPLTAGMDGEWTVGVSSARDHAGNPMEPAPDAYRFTVDATAPPNPDVSVGPVGCDRATLSWSAYAPPADLAGFQLYVRTDGAFTTVDGRSFARLLPATARSADLTDLGLEVPYEVAVAAFDRVGNVNTTVTSVGILIDEPVPPPVAVDVRPGADPDAAVVSWAGYDTAGLCGLAGFRVYRAEADFSSVAGVTPVADLPPDSREYEAVGLDRTRTYYFAVVAYNTAGEQNDAVTTGSWSDPYSGVITENTVIGGGAQWQIDIVRTLVVDGGAVLTVEPGTTLYFAQGAGLEVRNGRIVAQGTPFEPIVLTSEAARPGGTPQAGDWEGVVLGSDDTGSVLRHVFLEYGKGLQVRAASPTVEAFTAENNNGAGLLVAENGSLTTSAALLRYNDVGAEVATNGSLALTGSVLKSNALNARSDGTGAFRAEANWWGSPDPGVIGASIQGPVDWDPFLDHEPVLTPALATADGRTRVGSQLVDLVLASRNAEAVRLREDSTFPGAFFEPFTNHVTFELSPLGGEKTIFAQFKSPTGALSDPVPLTLTYVTEGPEIQAFSLTEGQEVGRPLEVTGSATAALGIAALEFQVDGTVVSSSDTGVLAFRWDVRDLTNGVHRVRLLARDTAGNESAAERNVLIQLVPPPAPAITFPADGLVVTGGTVDIRGTAEPLAPVRVSRDGFVVGNGPADETGAFAFTGIALREGSNRFVAVSEDSVGRSADSAPVTVVLDSAPPDAPELLSAEPQAGQGVLLSWKWAETGEVPDSYRIYRSGSPFTDPAAAVLVADAVRATDYLDENTPDGSWYYGVVAVDAAGNAGPVSNLLPIAYDGTPPAFAVSYDPEPPVGVGIVGITLTSSEPLRGIPSLVLRPHGSRSPASVVLARVDDTTYTGSFEITSGTPTGTTQVTVSGVDPAGNGFSGEPTGPTLVIDTDGPVGTVAVGVSEPVQVLDPRSVPVSLVLDEPVKPGTVPVLRYVPPVGDPVTVPLAGSGSAWAGQLALDPSMGNGVGRFRLSCEDALGNVGDRVEAGATLEIYNGVVPDPAPVPSGLATRALAGGSVRLSWLASEGATGYVVYRSAGACDAAPSERVAEGLTGNSYVDLPPADGMYCYAVASERLGAESDPSTAVPGLSDRTPPPPPQNVRVSLGAQGVRVAWDPPSGTEVPAGYAVYRNGIRVRTIAGTSTILAVDDHPGVGGTYTYVVASVDAVGNEAPSDPAVFDLTVGAVADLSVFVEEGAAPVLSWASTDSGAVGFNVYRGGVLLTPTPVSDPSFEDTSYSGDTVAVYDVRAVNAAGDESPSRTVMVWPLHIQAVANPDDAGAPQPLVAGYLNVLAVSVENRDEGEPFGPARLEVRTTVSGTEEYATSEDLPGPIGPGDVYSGETVMPVGDAADDRIARVQVVHSGATGEIVTYQRSFALGRAEDPGIVAELSVDDVPLAGGYSMVRVCLYNRGYASMDVVVARGSGAEPGDLFVAVQDAEGLEVSKAYFRGFPPGTRISGSTAYVSLEPGQTVCADIQVLVPEALEPGAVITFVGGAEQAVHGVGTGGPAVPGALTGTMQSGITLSEYYGTAQTDKDLYADGETVVIAGQALDRDTGAPVPDVPLKLGFQVRGYRWYQEVTTDAAGSYRVDYTPPAGLSGEFMIWAAHPDVYDAIDQDRFRYYLMYAIPSRGEIRTSKADTLAFRIQLYNPGDLPLDGFSYQFRAYTVDADGNQSDISSLHGSATLDGFAVAPGEKGSVQLELSADLDAPDNAFVEYRFVSSQGASAVFTAAVELAEAIPVLTVESPPAGYVDVSVDQGSMSSVSVTVRNTGLRPLENAEMTLPATVPWMSTNLPGDADGKVRLGTIGVGEAVTFDVVFSPPEDAAFGYHADRIVITGANAVQPFELRLYALVTSDQTGAVQFVVTNILGQKVEGATIRMRQPETRQEIDPVETDANGEVVVYGLQASEWSYQVVAPGHKTVAGVVTVVPSQTVVEEVFPVRNLVTINFSVVPVPYTDRYEIKLEQTFQTHVPLAVLVIDPPQVEFRDVKPGFEATFTVKAMNKGLIKLEELTISSAQVGGATLQPLITYIPELGPMGTVEIPFRITYDEVQALPGGVASWLDCTTGGFGGLAEALINLLSIFRGRTFCLVTPEEARNLLAVASGLLVFLHVWKAPRDLIGLIANALTCLAQEIAKPFRSGSDLYISPGSSFPPKTVCFAADTPVRMADGSVKPIQDVRKGDRVMSVDGTPAPVDRTYVRRVEAVRELRYRSEGGAAGVRRLVTTDEHRFWVAGKGWTPARALSFGDELVLYGGVRGVVEANESIEQPSTVYNLDVAGYRSYFANDALVHQRCWAGENDLITWKLRQELGTATAVPAVRATGPVSPAAAEEGQR